MAVCAVDVNPTCSNPVRAVRGEALSFLRNVALPYQDRAACLDWPFSRKKEGYGNIVINGKYCVVSRVVCEAAHGAPPEPSNEAAHSCGNASCCNPWHLSWKTRKGNEGDKTYHGTALRGEKIAQSKLTQADVLKIRGLTDKTQAQISKIYNVSPGSIGKIQRRQTWSWL